MRVILYIKIPYKKAIEFYEDYFSSLIGERQMESKVEDH